MLDLKKIIKEKGIDVGLIGAALNISDEKVTQILDENDPGILDDILLGEFARVLDIDILELIK